MLSAKSRASASHVIEAMYAVAANPDRWEEIIDALGADPADVAVPGSEGVARLARLAAKPAGGATVGVLLIAANGSVAACNPAGDAVVHQRLGTIEAHGLSFFDPSNHEVLVQARQRLRESAARQVIVKFSQAADEGPHFAYVTPAAALPADLAASLPWRGEFEPSQIAFIFPAVEMTDRLWASVRESFGLTPAETRLAARLKDGFTLRDAASDLGVSVNTVRNQLRAIFEKMGLNRQSDLVRALTQLSSLAGALQAEEGEGVAPAVLGAARPAAESAPPLRDFTLPDGRRLAYRDYGSPLGRPVLVVHQGMGCSLLPRGSDALARDLRLRLICPERPGSGRSDPRPDFTFEGVGQDMADLAVGLNLRNIQVAGFMSGVAYAFAAARALGDRVDRLLAISTRPPGAHRETERDAVHKLVLFRRRIMRSPWLSDAIFSMMRMQLNRRQIGRLVRTGASSPGDGAYLAAHPGVVDYISDYMLESFAITSRGASDEVKCGARTPMAQAPDLGVPVVLWHGADDPLSSPDEASAWIGAQAAEIRIFPGIGHFLPHRHWSDILAWLAGGQASQRLVLPSPEPAPA